MIRKGRLTSICALLIFQLYGCASFTHVSSWKDRAIMIDGNDADWQGKMTLHGSLSMGTCNDKDNLYICLSTTDKDVLSQLAGMYGQNFTLWLDPGEKQKKSFGIRFSYARQPGDRAPATGQGRDAPAKPEFAGKSPDRSQGMPAPTIEIMENGSAVAKLADTSGIEAVLRQAKSGRQLVCELKVPLIVTDTARYAVQALPGTQIKMCFEASAMQNKEMARGTMPQGEGGPGQGMDGGAGAPPMDNAMMGGSMDRGGGAPPPMDGGMLAGGMDRGNAPPMGGGNRGGTENSGTTTSPVNVSGKILLAIKNQ